MRLTKHELASLPERKRSRRQPGSLASLAAEAGMPLGTLKSRVKTLVDRGYDRDKAIKLALETPIGPQGRPRNP